MLPGKANKATSLHMERLSQLNTNPVFQCLLKKIISKHYSNWPASVVTAAAEVEVTELAYFSQVISAELFVLEYWVFDSECWIGHYYFVELKKYDKLYFLVVFLLQASKKNGLQFRGKTTTLS